MNVVDSKNISYEVLEKLGEGSQGVTYLLKDKKHIVKLFNQSFWWQYNQIKINFLINLGLDKKVFAVPLRQITQPKNGYVSEFASGMIPLSSLKLGTENTNLAEWYLSSGGILKRYNVLIRLAALLRAYTVRVSPIVIYHLIMFLYLKRLNQIMFFDWFRQSQV